MTHPDLATFLAHLDDAHDLIRIAVPVDPAHELAAIIRHAQSHPATDHALLFENVSGSRIPVAANLFGTERRITQALGLSALDDLRANLAHLIDLSDLDSAGGLMSRAGDVFGLVRSIGLNSRPVRRAPCQDVIITDAPSLDRLPFPTLWPGDGGPSLPLAALTWRDPGTGKQRSEAVRIQRHDVHTLLLDGLHAEPAINAAQTPIPTAVVLGGAPADIWSAAAPLPAALNPAWLAGYLHGRPVPVTACQTQELTVPAHAEIVIEGFIVPGAQQSSGPIRRAGGHYSPSEALPVMQVTAITHRQQPVLPLITDHDQWWMTKAGERLLLPLLQQLLPALVDINLNTGSQPYQVVSASAATRYHGHAQQLMHGLWGLGPLARSQAIIIVEASVDVQDRQAVAAAVRDHTRWPRDLMLVSGMLDHHHPAARTPGYGGKIGIDATGPAADAQAPRETPDLPGVLAGWPVAEWATFEGAWLIVSVDGTGTPPPVPDLVEQVWQAAPGWPVVVVDAGIDPRRPEDVLSAVLGNVDWSRDILIKNGPVTPDAPGAVGIDATRRSTHHQPSDFGAAPGQPDEQAIARLVRQRWTSYGLDTPASQ